MKTITKITKFMSSNRKVPRPVRPEDRSPIVKDLDLKFDSLRVYGTLGTQWNVENDTFNVVVGGKIQPETRRGILFWIATIYDPLGYVGLLLLPCSDISQDLCIMKYEWDEKLPYELIAR